jgi:hypothetical protein
MRAGTPDSLEGAVTVCVGGTSYSPLFLVVCDLDLWDRQRCSFMHPPLLEGIRATSVFNMTCLLGRRWSDFLSARWLKISQPHSKDCMK